MQNATDGKGAHARLRITVYGDPAPQGSKKFLGTRGGRGILVESSKKVKPWRQDVVAAALEAKGTEVLDGALSVRMVFTLAKPVSAPKRKRSWPNKKPDLSKLVRSTEDALVTAGVIADDARIVEYERVAKVFPGEDPESLGSPGVYIEIRSISAAEVTHAQATDAMGRGGGLARGDSLFDMGGLAHV